MAKKETYYIGSNKVKDYIVHENINLVGVMLENGKSEDYTNEQWANLKSEEAYDDGMISIRKHEKIMVRMLKEMVESRVTLQEHEWILQRLGELIGGNYRNAIAKLFDIDDPTQIMLAQIDEILQKNFVCNSKLKEADLK